MENNNNFWVYAQQYGNKICYRGIENGNPVTKSVAFEPTLFVNSNKPSKWKALYGGRPLQPIKFESIKEAKKFSEQYKGVEGFEVHGFTRFQYQYINDNFAGDVEYDLSKLNILFLDIEVVGDEGDGFPDIRSANLPIVMISLYSTIDKEKIVLGLKDFVPEKDDNITYKKFDSEKDLLLYYVYYIQSNYPHAISGWNSSQFDTTYIINRLLRLFNESVVKRLSPFNMVHEKLTNIMGKEVQTYDIVGIIELDYLELYKKFTNTSRESYALGFIAQEELGKTKVEMPGKSFYDNYTNYFDDFARYCAIDSFLVNELEQKLKLIELSFSMMFLYHCNLQDVFRTVLPWEVFIFNHLASKNIAVPPRTDSFHSDFEGAWVKDTVPGMYGWCMTYDFGSLYPSIIRQWNISPETYILSEHHTDAKDYISSSETSHLAITEAKRLDASLAVNGTMYDKTKQGFLAELMELTMEGRKITKREMLVLESEYQQTKDESLLPKIASLNMRQMALKISANSVYGAIGNVGFHYYNHKIAEAITTTGQLSDMHLAEVVNKKLNKILGTTADYILGADTDSIMVSVDSIVGKFQEGKDVKEITKFLDRFGEEILQPVVSGSIDHIFSLMNCFDKVMSAKREVIASKGLFTAKKKYAMYVHNSEGVEYPTPKLKVMGLEIVRSSTPKICRSWLKECLQLMFEKGETELRQRVGEIRDEFLNSSPEQIAFPRGVSDVDKYKDKTTIYKKGTPAHVRGSLLHNLHYPNAAPIQSGDKIKFVYLKIPNIIKENIISFGGNDKFPDDLLKKYIDYDVQFEKSFLKPLESLTTCCGWELEEKSSLELFFG